MEKYIKPDMEIVELEKNLVIVTSCAGAAPDETDTFWCAGTDV